MGEEKPGPHLSLMMDCIWIFQLAEMHPRANLCNFFFFFHIKAAIYTQVRTSDSHLLSVFYSFQNVGAKKQLF